MAARVSRIFDITLRAVIALCLASLCVVQSAAHPRKADAVPIAIPIAVGVGAVIATALGAYGIQAVNSGRSAEDVGTSFISWITSKDLDDFWDAQTDIKSAQMAINSIYQMGLDGSMNLALWTTNEQNAINSVYGSLMQMWASDGFAASAPSGTAGSVTYGGLSFNTVYSDVPISQLVGGDFSSFNSTIKGIITTTDGSLYYWLSGGNSRSGLGIVCGSDGAWSFTDSNGNTTYTYNTFTVYDIASGSWRDVYINSNTFDISNIVLNTNTNIYFWQNSSALSNNLPTLTSASGVPNRGAGSLVGSYDASLDLWSGDISYDAGIEGSIFDKFSDALSQGINDLLSQQIPLGADYVYNPSTQALEQQGSVPVIQDWSRVADWADVLERIRAGTLDGSQVIDNTTTGVRADTITDTLVEGEAIQDWPMRSWETPSPEVGTIGAAINFTGETIGEKFPFSTWGDVVAISNILAVDALAPEFDMPVIGFDGSGFTVERVHISLAGFEGVAIVIRLMFLILMILGVIWLAVRQLKAFQGV